MWINERNRRKGEKKKDGGLWIRWKGEKAESRFCFGTDGDFRFLFFGFYKKAVEAKTAGKERAEAVVFYWGKGEGLWTNEKNNGMERAKQGGIVDN